jgi:hypothetical protein
MLEKEKTFHKNVSALVINYLLQKGLLSLEFDKYAFFKCGVEEIEHEGIMLFVIYTLHAYPQVDISIRGFNIGDSFTNDENIKFTVLGHFLRSPKYYIMDIDYPECLDQKYNPYLKRFSNPNDEIMNAWINKYETENVEPNGYSKSGQYLHPCQLIHIGQDEK